MNLKGESRITLIPERRRHPRVNIPPPEPDLAWCYFFDIDGTLAEIASHPRGARVERNIRHLIDKLYHETNGAVALITGRSLHDADRLMGSPALPTAGQHGLERRNASGEILTHDFDTRAFGEVCEEIRIRSGSVQGIVAELKGLSIALHYRGAPEQEQFAHDLISTARQRLGNQFMTLHGKMVVELKPAGKDKGVAIREFLDEVPFKGRVPVFAGDDITDEFGFDVINAMNGHSIKVGGGPTGAHWRLRTVADVREWLERAFVHGEN